jgi:tetratricopeptide (TPR) repeat protein
MPALSTTFRMLVVITLGGLMPSLCCVAQIPRSATADDKGEFAEALTLRGKGDWDGALAKISDVIQHEPANSKYYVLRGDLYAKKKMWTESEKDFLTSQKIDPADVTTKFDLAEIQLMQKKFEDARPGFHALENDPDLGDLATYKVFLCDLFGGQEDTAARQLNLFDKAGGNASYYYANAAWLLFHDRPDDARSWLQSAWRIYPRRKCYNYESTLDELGYLPLVGP